MPAESLLTFARSYAAWGHEIAVRQRRGYRMETWTYGRIGQEANRVARELEDRGICKGDAALFWGDNSAEWIAAFLGCLLVGVVIVPIDHASTSEFACRVARDVDAKLVFRSRGNENCANLPSIELENLTSAVAGRDPSPLPSPALSRRDTLEIIYTSGTTAEPRGVLISHGNVLANIERLDNEIQKYLRYERPFHPLRFLNLLPLSHVFGQMLGVFIPQMLAATVVFLDTWKPAELTETICKERISVMIAVPRFLESLQREIERQLEREQQMERFQKDFVAGQQEHFLRRWWRFRRIHSRLGWKFWAFISGGAALPEQTETFWTRLGYAVIQGYGMTETTSLISLNHPFSSTKGSIGKVFPGMEVRVAESGEIMVRGEGVAQAYRQSGLTQTLVESDGWFHTGDIAQKDDDGRLYFKGRSKNVIVTPAGMNVYPEDLEKALRAQPGVKDCVVLGIEKDGNAEASAVLLLSSAASNARSIVDGANRSLAEYQKIRNWLVWPHPDFPRTPTQKPVIPKIREAIRTSSDGSSTMPASGDALNSLISRITHRAAPSDSNAALEVDLNLSSLDRVELMSALEEQYQVELSETQFQDVSTVKQLEKLISRGVAPKVQLAYPHWPQHWLTTIFRLAIYYALAWPATYLLAAPRVRGREHLRGLKGPVLIVSNHVTYLDIAWILPALPARFRNRLATAMRGERLAEMRHPAPTLSWFARFMERLRYVLVTSLFNVFPLPQYSGFLKSFHFAGDLTDRGWNTLVFPEGQTTVTGEMVPFRTGIGLLAKQLNIPVLPMHLDGLFDLKTDRRILTWPGHVRVTIGEPVRVWPNQDPNEIAQELERRVRALQSA
ncbi:MAG TPA: AMP-binding protein [Methylomirabilota bacterium]|nr:AMP-binding protein [Methylomirabilota bacterium]